LALGLELDDNGPGGRRADAASMSMTAWMPALIGGISPLGARMRRALAFAWAVNESRRKISTFKLAASARGHKLPTYAQRIHAVHG
jgi:hypothetical protein